MRKDLVTFIALGVAVVMSRPVGAFPTGAPIPRAAIAIAHDRPMTTVQYRGYRYYAPPAYYAPRPYYAPPVMYYPPPVVYYPPPVVYGGYAMPFSYRYYAPSRRLRDAFAPPG
jgi:hypothetical protein